MDWVRMTQSAEVDSMPVDEQGREYDESWDLATGLVDDVDAVVVGSEFGYRENYNDQDGNPQTLMILSLLPDGASEPIEVRFSVGKGWEPSPDGRSAVRQDGKKKFIQSSMYGQLLARARGLWPDIITRGPAYQAGIFDGTKWHWKMEKIEYGGRLESREHLMPTKFLGVEQVKGVKAKASANDDLIAELTALAIASDTHKEFVAAFLRDKELQNRTKEAGMLKDVLNSKADGFWAKARAEAGS
jgi:hypothetical protein